MHEVASHAHFKMKPKSKHFGSALFSLSALSLATCACVSQAHAAGDAAATSSYLTIQPNAAGTAYVYTFSWVARDTDNAGGGAVGVAPNYTDTGLTGHYGNGGAALKNVTNLGGGDYIFDNTANGGDAATKIRYYASALAPSGDSHIRYETNPVNTTTWVNYQDPLDTTIGGTAPTAATPRFDTIGNFATNSMNVIIVGSGVQGVTGVFSTNPDGTGAATGQGVGFYIDHDGADDETGTDDFGPLLVGYDTIQNPNKTNPMPSTGYVQVIVPYPTTGVVSDAFLESFYPGTYTRNAAVEVVVTTDSSYTPKIAVSGDFNSDLNVDADDLTAAAAGFGGAGVAGKWYANGDMDSDGDVDNADLGAVIGAFTPNSASATTAELIYNPTTGNVKLDASDAAGSMIVSFQLENGDASFVPGSYASPDAAFGGAYEDVTANVIGDSDLTLTGFSGVADLGNVFPTDLDLAGLEAYLITAVYTGTEGTGQQTFDFVIDSSGGGGPTFTTWSGGAAADEDTNGDGIANGIAWALGASSPNENAIGLLPTLDNTSDPDFFIFNFNRSDEANDDPGTTIVVEYASDLSDWTAAVAGDDVIITETPGSPKDAVEVKIRRTLAVGDKLFARLKVVVTP